MTDMKDQPDFSDPEMLRQLRARQRSRAIAMAAILGGMCVLFYVVTVVKMGLAS
ncbi:MAG: hypothetical protein R3E02_09035 [Blastomonas sp.]